MYSRYMASYIFIFEKSIAHRQDVSIAQYNKLHPPLYIYAWTCLSEAFIFCDNSSHQLAYCRDDTSG